MITAEQIQHYELFGFLFLPRAFNATEMAAIGQAFDELLCLTNHPLKP